MDGMTLPLALGGALGLAALVLRGKGVQVFLLLCSGFELNRLYGDDLAVRIHNFAINSSLPIDQIVAGVLLLLPAVLVVLMSRKQAKKKKLLPHLVGSVAAGWMATVWSAQTVLKNIPKSGIYVTMFHWQAAVMGAGVVAALLLVFLERPKPDSEGDKKKSKG